VFLPNINSWFSVKFLRAKNYMARFERTHLPQMLLYRFFHVWSTLPENGSSNFFPEIWEWWELPFSTTFKYVSFYTHNRKRNQVNNHAKMPLSYN
jgi:hypothetical protein